VSEALAPLVAASEAELEEWIRDLGGVDRVSSMRRALLEDGAWLGVGLRFEVLRFAGSGDPSCLDRIPTLVNSRRAALTSAGLDRVEEPEIDLGTYLAARSEALENGAEEAIASEDAPEVEEAGEVQGERSEPAATESGENGPLGGQVRGQEPSPPSESPEDSRGSGERP